MAPRQSTHTTCRHELPWGPVAGTSPKGPSPSYRRCPSMSATRSGERNPPDQPSSHCRRCRRPNRRRLRLPAARRRRSPRSKRSSVARVSSRRRTPRTPPRRAQQRLPRQGSCSWSRAVSNSGHSFLHRLNSTRHLLRQKVAQNVTPTGVSLAVSHPNRCGTVVQ